MLDLHRGGLSWRRVQALVRGLPPDAAVYRRVEHLGGWTSTDHLLAAVVDMLGVVSYHALVGPHADPKRLRGVKPPPRLPRPGHRRKRRKATSAELREFFGSMRGGE